MNTTQNTQTNNNVDNNMTASVIKNATNQLHNQIAEWNKNQEQLQDEINRLEELINIAETTKNAMINLTDEIR